MQFVLSSSNPSTAEASLSKVRGICTTGQQADFIITVCTLYAVVDVFALLLPLG